MPERGEKLWRQGAASDGRISLLRGPHLTTAPTFFTVPRSRQIAPKPAGKVPGMRAARLHVFGRDQNSPTRPAGFGARIEPPPFTLPTSRRTIRGGGKTRPPSGIVFFHGGRQGWPP